MLVGSRRFVPRYRAVSESTADAATDDDDYDKEYDDDDAGGGVASGSYESFSRCDLMLADAADDSTAPLRSHPRTGTTTDMYYLLDTVPPIRVVCKNVATVNIPPKMAASSVPVISVEVCLWTVCGCKYIANKSYRCKTN